MKQAWINKKEKERQAKLAKIMDTVREKLKSAENLMTRFICYAIVGWLYEVVLWIFEQHQIMNRGFCFGPWLPIYGFGGILLYYTIYQYALKEQQIGPINIKPLLVCLIIAASAATVELISTYIMDMAGLDFHTLWSYDDYAINFQERIAFLPAIKFGILGCIIIYMAQDKIDMFLRSKDSRAVYLRYVLCFLFIIDVVIHLVKGSNYTDVPLFYL